MQWPPVRFQLGQSGLRMALTTGFCLIKRLLVFETLDLMERRRRHTCIYETLYIIMNLKEKLHLFWNATTISAAEPYKACHAK